jgi:hypothetical protein
VGLGIGLGILMLAILLSLGYWLPIVVGVADAPAVVTRIPPPTLTPTPRPTLQPTATPSTAAGAGASRSFTLGELVVIRGTGGQGLRLRNSPGLASPISLLGLDSEVFEVRGGPEYVDGYQWWFLVSPYDSSLQGWAAADFLFPLAEGTAP